MVDRADKPLAREASASHVPDPLEEEDTDVTGQLDRKAREHTVRIQRVGPRPDPEEGGHAGPRLPHERAFDPTEIRTALGAKVEDDEEAEPRRALPAEAEVESHGGWLSHPMAGWIAAAVTAVLLVLLTLFATPKVEGIDPVALTAFYAEVDGEHFSEAEVALQGLALGPEPAAALRAHLVAARADAARRHGAEAERWFGAKGYREAADEARLAVIAAPSADSLFIHAESLRLLGDAGDGELYARFLSAYPQDPRRDDALFWSAEAQVRAGRLAAAKESFGAVAAMEESDFKRSAVRRLEELAAAAASPGATGSAGSTGVAPGVPGP